MHPNIRVNSFEKKAHNFHTSQRIFSLAHLKFSLSQTHNNIPFSVICVYAILKRRTTRKLWLNAFFQSTFSLTVFQPTFCIAYSPNLLVFPFGMLHTVSHSNHWRWKLLYILCLESCKYTCIYLEAIFFYPCFSKKFCTPIFVFGLNVQFSRRFFSRKFYYDSYILFLQSHKYNDILFAATILNDI